MTHTTPFRRNRPPSAAAGLLDASSSRIATRIHLEHTTIPVDSQNEWSVLREVSTLKARWPGAGVNEFGLPSPCWTTVLDPEKRRGALQAPRSAKWSIGYPSRALPHQIPSSRFLPSVLSDPSWGRATVKTRLAISVIGLTPEWGVPQQCADADLAPLKRRTG